MAPSKPSEIPDCLAVYLWFAYRISFRELLLVIFQVFLCLKQIFEERN